MSGDAFDRKPLIDMHMYTMCIMSNRTIVQSDQCVSSMMAHRSEHTLTKVASWQAAGPGHPPKAALAFAYIHRRIFALFFEGGYKCADGDREYSYEG